MTDVLRERLKTVPNRPGCYLMRDRRGVIIYVGKAKNLRRRVLSYFRPHADLAPKVRSMVNTVADLEFMTVKNDAEALLTEAALIKKHKPHFNILMRDDKRYLALRADPDAPFPRFATCRIVRDDGARYFGPFPSAPVVRAAKDFVEKHYGLRSCDALTPDADAHTHCLADVIRFCTAPCLGKIGAAEYRARFEEVEPLLSLTGKPRRPVALLGPARAAALAANAILPFLAATRPELAGQLCRGLPSETVSAPMRTMANRLFGRDHNPGALYSADGLRQQGLLQIFADFCLNARGGCAGCRFAHG